MENKENKNLRNSMNLTLSRSSSISSFHSVEKPGSPASPTISRNRNRSALISKEELEQKTAQGNSVNSGDKDFLDNVIGVLSGERNVDFLLKRHHDLKINLEVRVKLENIETQNYVEIVEDVIESFPEVHPEMEGELQTECEVIFFHLIGIYETIIARKKNNLFHFAVNSYNGKLLNFVERYYRQHCQFDEHRIAELVNQRNSLSLTPLHAACLSTAAFRNNPVKFSWEIINKLVQLGADKELTDKNDRNFQVLIEGKMGLNFFSDYQQQAAINVETVSEVQAVTQLEW